MVDNCVAIPSRAVATRFWTRLFWRAVYAPKDAPRAAVIFAAKPIFSRLMESTLLRTRVAEFAVVRNELMVPPTDAG